MEVDAGAGRDIGEPGLLVQEEDQACPLAEVGGCGTTEGEVLGTVEEFGREGGSVQWWRARHGRDPRAMSRRDARDDTLTVAKTPAATLQLFAERTTKGLAFSLGSPG
jgi:hypothetical protein